MLCADPSHVHEFAANHGILVVCATAVHSGGKRQRLPCDERSNGIKLENSVTRAGRKAVRGSRRAC
jgi:hypothetical protein